MPNAPKTPPIKGHPLPAMTTRKAKSPLPKTRATRHEARAGLNALRGQPKGGRPPRFPGRTGGR